MGRLSTTECTYLPTSTLNTPLNFFLGSISFLVIRRTPHSILLQVVAISKLLSGAMPRAFCSPRRRFCGLLLTNGDCRS